MTRKLSSLRVRGWPCLIWILALPLVGFAALAVDIQIYSTRSDLGQADAAVVLGAAVEGDQPSPVFRERIEHAIDLYRQGRVRALVFTGGTRTSEPAESSVAIRYAIDRGVPATSLFGEARSRVTYGNLVEAKPILDQQGLRRVLVVSDPLHMRRAMVMAHDLGLDAGSSPTPTTRYVTLRSRLPFLARETYFYASYLLARSWRSGADE